MTESEVYLIGRDPVPQSITMGEGESRSITLVALPGTSAHLSMEVDMVAPGASLDLAGLYICPEDEKLELDILVRHSSGGCNSRQLFKGVVGGHASACFGGLIYVAHDAQRTKAYQENHNLLLSNTAVVDSRPQLEIYADDVECSHGATSGHLDESQLFYMRSRGIPEAEARRLQLISFLAPVASRLPEDLMQKVYESIA